MINIYFVYFVFCAAEAFLSLSFILTYFVVEYSIKFYVFCLYDICCAKYEPAVGSHFMRDCQVRGTSFIFSTLNKLNRTIRETGDG